MRSSSPIFIIRCYPPQQRWPDLPRGVILVVVTPPSLLCQEHLSNRFSSTLYFGFHVFFRLLFFCVHLLQKSMLRLKYCPYISICPNHLTAFGLSILLLLCSNGRQPAILSSRSSGSRDLKLDFKPVI